VSAVIRVPAWPRSLSNDCLYGKRMMRLVYMDEAGIGNPDQEPFLVVAGVIVHADNDLIAIERHLDRLVEKFIPEHQRSGFVFHAKELFNGGGKVFVRDGSTWTLEKRLEIADQLALVPRKFNLTLAMGSVERARFPLAEPENANYQALSAGEKVIVQHLVAFVNCAMQVEHWMRGNAGNEVCMLIVEDNERSRKFIRQNILALQQRKFQSVGLADENIHFPFRKIKEEPLFQSKRSSSVLQLADFCAYIFKRFLMDQNDKRYVRFLDPMRPYFSYLTEERWQQTQRKFDREAKRKLAAIPSSSAGGG
jgi:hypothetical protein